MEPTLTAPPSADDTTTPKPASDDPAPLLTLDAPSAQTARVTGLPDDPRAPDKEEKNKREIFGSFFLNDSEFALPVTTIQEVINPPAAYTALPLAPAYVLGLLNLRGMIIPVVDLKKLLKMPAGSTHQKITILKLNGHCIGLLFDRTGEIFPSLSEERSEFVDEAGELAVISGAFKKDQGRRLIQILAADALFVLKHLPHPKAQPPQKTQLRGQRQQCISFQVGGALCAIKIDQIQEILKLEKINESIISVAYCLGSIDSRGTTVPVVDFAAFLGYPKTELETITTTTTAAPPPPHATGALDDRRIIVMCLQDERFGILVQRVENLVSFYPPDLKPFPLLSADHAKIFSGLITLPEKEDLLLLEHEQIFSRQEIQDMTHGHSRIYQAKNSQNLKQSTKEQRRTFITFTVETPFAISIHEVKEIIQPPTVLLHPPGLPPHCQGILNLRGELVTLIAGRALLGYPPAIHTSPSKVLIFKKGDLHFGLIVDSVEAIVSSVAAQQLKMPDLFYQKDDTSNTTPALHVTEALELKNKTQPQQKEQLVPILTFDALAAQLQPIAA